MHDQVTLARNLGVSKTAITEMWQHARENLDIEICGVVSSKGDYVACENIHPDPDYNFALKASPEQIEDCIAIVHSHPNETMAVLSAADMQASIDYDKPYIVLATNENNDRDMTVYRGGCQPLLERAFRHGSSDCYTAIIDWYDIHYGVKLLDHPRDWQWWKNGSDLYLDLFPKTGFVDIGRTNHLKEGDLVLARILSKVHNHAAVYTGSGLIYHQIGGPLPVDMSRLAAREPITRYHGILDKETVLRHKSLM